MAVVSIKNKLRRGNLLVGNAFFMPSAFESIATATGTGSSTSLTFSSIPSTYQHLQIRGIGKATATTSRSGLLSVQCNSDTGANYAAHRLRGDGTSVLAGGNASTTYTYFQDCLAYSKTATPDMANIFGAFIIDIHDYSSTSKYKTIRGFGGVDANYSSVDFEINLISGLWMNTAAINSITLNANDPLTTTTTFALYGIRGA